MTRGELQQKILTDDTVVLDETRKLQKLYKLKEEIRYNHQREESITSESVAEHVYGMFLLAYYFLRLEDSERNWDQQKVFNMILWHDMDEIITGDKIGYLKTEADREREKTAMQQVYTDLSVLLKDEVKVTIDEYETRETKEAKFVKAIDRIEPLFHLYNKNGKLTLRKNKTTVEQSKSLKDDYVVDFPYLKRFNEVLTARMVKEGFFHA